MAARTCSFIHPVDARLAVIGPRQLALRDYQEVVVVSAGRVYWCVYVS